MNNPILIQGNTVIAGNYENNEAIIKPTTIPPLLTKINNLLDNFYYT